MTPSTPRIIHICTYDLILFWVLAWINDCNWAKWDSVAEKWPVTKCDSRLSSNRRMPTSFASVEIPRLCLQIPNDEMNDLLLIASGNLKYWGHDACLNACRIKNIMHYSMPTIQVCRGYTCQVNLMASNSPITFLNIQWVKTWSQVTDCWPRTGGQEDLKCTLAT